MKKFVSLFLSLLLTVATVCRLGLPVGSAPATGRSEPPSVNAEGACLVNAEDGSVYFEKNADLRLGMASTTKLMTALVILEEMDPDTVISVSAEAVGVEGSSIYLIEGERLTVRQLLYALLLSSANDAAAALAIAHSGSVEEFAEAMNRRAYALGLRSTHFTNPHGLYDEAHYTTARELALIALQVLRHPLLRQIVSTYKATIPHDGRPDQRLLINHNKLLRTYDGAIGMKTGFTKKTGRTLVSAAERNGLLLIAVTLNDPDDWRDHAALLDYGFATYERITLDAGTFCYALPVTGGDKDTVLLTNLSPLALTLPRERGSLIYTVESTGRFEFAPVKKDEPLGTVTVRCDGRSATSPLVATHSLEAKAQGSRSLWERLRALFTTSTKGNE